MGWQIERYPNGAGLIVSDNTVVGSIRRVEGKFRVEIMRAVGGSVFGEAPTFEDAERFVKEQETAKHLSGDTR